ncbi:MAG: hypothetical protein E7167_01215 [Firmicutes bacterium]|nr:hypothetical protein [Bacillota bacterium]
MARVIEKPSELITKCPHCGAKIGFDKSDVVVDILWPSIDCPGLYIEDQWAPIIYRKLTCPYCQKTIYLEKDYDKEVF